MGETQREGGAISYPFTSCTEESNTCTHTHTEWSHLGCVGYCRSFSSKWGAGRDSLGAICEEKKGKYANYKVTRCSHSTVNIPLSKALASLLPHLESLRFEFNKLFADIRPFQAAKPCGGNHTCPQAMCLTSVIFQRDGN